jgi:hypothetical protein
MADLLSPSAAPVQPMSQSVEERPYRPPRSPAKKRPPAEQPRSAPDTETDSGPPDDDQPTHALDIDA